MEENKKDFDITGTDTKSTDVNFNVNEWNYLKFKIKN